MSTDAAISQGLSASFGTKKRKNGRVRMSNMSKRLKELLNVN